MSLFIEWDDEKARQNARKYHVPFEEAATVFSDPLSLTIDDPLHSSQENRFITVGRSNRGTFLVVAHTERGDTIRIISARRATRSERNNYEEHQE